MSKEHLLRVKLPSGENKSVKITKDAIRSKIVKEMQNKFTEFDISIDNDMWLLKYKSSYQRSTDFQTTVAHENELKNYDYEHVENIMKLSDEVLVLRMFSENDYQREEPQTDVEKAVEKYLMKSSVIQRKSWTLDFIHDIRKYMKRLHVKYAIIEDYFYDPHVIPLQGRNADASAHLFWKDARRLHASEIKELMEQKS